MITTAAKEVSCGEPTRSDNVTALGVGEHIWSHTGVGDRYVTVIIDLTQLCEQTCPARLLNMALGRSKKAFKAWPGARRQA